MTAEHQEEVQLMAGSANLYSDLANSLAPGVHGHEDVKRAILLMLLGGVHKETAEVCTRDRLSFGGSEVLIKTCRYCCSIQCEHACSNIYFASNQSSRPGILYLSLQVSHISLSVCNLGLGPQSTATDRHYGQYMSTITMDA